MNKWVLLVFLVSNREPPDDAIAWRIDNTEQACWKSFNKMSSTVFKKDRVISRCMTIKEALDEYELHWL